MTPVPPRRWYAENAWKQAWEEGEKRVPDRERTKGRQRRTQDRPQRRRSRGCDRNKCRDGTQNFVLCICISVRRDSRPLTSGSASSDRCASTPLRGSRLRRRNPFQCGADARLGAPMAMCSVLASAGRLRPRCERTVRFAAVRATLTVRRSRGLFSASAELSAVVGECWILMHLFQRQPARWPRCSTRCGE